MFISSYYSRSRLEDLIVWSFLYFKNNYRNINSNQKEKKKQRKQKLNKKNTKCLIRLLLHFVSIFVNNKTAGKRIQKQNKNKNKNKNEVAFKRFDYIFYSSQISYPCFLPFLDYIEKCHMCCLFT